jgi:heterodisulfide reductase subunit A-like polyferredoxin
MAGNMLSVLENENTGAVLVCGADIAGIHASLELANSGFKVYLLDAAAAIGSRLAQLDKIFPADDCAMCVLSPRLVECARNKNIEIITLADIQNVSGRPGRFNIKIRKNPRYIDRKKCDACGNCVDVCPISLPNEYGDASDKRKAIFRPYLQAIPNVFAISKAEGQAPCKVSCPAGVNVPGVTALLAAGKFTEAYDLIRRRCPIPASCGRVCLHPCQSSCNRNSIDEAVSFSNLERFIGDFIHENPELCPPFSPLTPLSDEKIAVIGSGPAGLTAATDLALMGYGVTLFEVKPQLGGMLRYGIPGYRLPKSILDKDIQSIVDLGISVKTNTHVARPKDLLKANAHESDGGFNAVFVATGAWARAKLGIPGEDANGVVDVLDFLSAENEGHAPKIGPKVVVIGGSDLAVYGARTALRIPGVESVHIACLESLSEMPAHSEQTAQALTEGVLFHNGLGPTRIVSHGENATSATFRACTSVFDNYRGYKRYNPLFDDSRVSILQADTVIVAAGRGVDSVRYGMDTRPGGRILVDDETLAAGIDGIFAGGDAVLGPASVVEAIAHGHKAAAAIDNYIRRSAMLRNAGSLQISGNDPLPVSPVKYAAHLHPDALRQNRVEMPRSGVSGRPRDMNELHRGYSREQALLEAGRCLSCGLCSECMECVKACTAGAILHNQQAAEIEIEAGSIIFGAGTEKIIERLGLDAHQSGLAQQRPLSGIYMADVFSGPKDIAESVVWGSAAAASAMEQLTLVRGTMAQRREYPWERDVADETPRIGVFVCQCGNNISSAIDVAEVSRRAARLPDVCLAETSVYTCSEANQQHIRDVIRKYRLNRLVVASCSSRTHEVMFQETLRESGLNQYLLAVTDIRDQCSWVHRDDPEIATAKAIDLVSTAVARARHLKPLPLHELPVTASALILGGGLAGMTAARSIAGQGFKVHLIERESSLGGLLRNVRKTSECDDVQSYLRQLINETCSNPKITVCLNSDLSKIFGQAGNFKSILNVAGKETSVSHGVVIVATGGCERSGEQLRNDGNPSIARILGIALNADGFFLEAHPRLRPVDLANEGEFLCGLAHAPCSMGEAIVQAQAAAARASTILSKTQLEIMRQMAVVNPAECIACATCVKICPYNAPIINELRKSEIQSAKCMGCGSCAAACPSKAIVLQHQEGETISAMLDELLVNGGGPR